MAESRTLNQWLYEPTFEESVCRNTFHDIMRRVYDGIGVDDLMNPYSPDPEDYRFKVACLVEADLVLLCEDAIYVREGDTLHTVGDSQALLAYYMHTDSKEARKAIDILETNFQGYVPIADGKVWRDVVCLEFPDGLSYVDLKTLKEVPIPELVNSNGERIAKVYPEFGKHGVDQERFAALAKFFATLDSAVGDPWFFEKAIMYHFMQPYREKSHVLVGGGGNGKSMFMGLVQKLFGDFALTDAPQPKFSGHDTAVISYNFVGKRMVTFNDVGDPSSKFLEWLKRMITGNLEVKTPSGSWLSVPCNANFMMETNHVPEVLELEAHRRRFVIREFDPCFKLKDYMDDSELDLIGDRGSVTAGDIVAYLMSVKDEIGDWTDFAPRPQLGPDGEEVAE